MITESSIEIDASAGTVWDVFTDVERWSDWTASVQRVTALDGAALAVGRRFRIKQPRLPNAVWTVTELEPGRSWTWRYHAPGNTTLASHEVVAMDDGRTFVRQRIDQRGVIGATIGALVRRTTRRYLTMEAEGLKTASERVAPGRTASTADATPA
jgi:hypothetical protein